MHPYSTDSNERKHISLLLAFLSIIAAYLLSFSNNAIPWWIDAPSVFGFYGLFYYMFDRYAWKSKWLSKLNLVKIPDLNGNWSGHLESSYDDFGSKKIIDVDINQSWTKIEIFLKTENSTSDSISASLLVHDLTSPRLSYEYLNDPNPDAPPTSQIHRGYARFTYNSDPERLKGDYFNGRGRGTYGEIYLERNQSKARNGDEPQ